MDATESGSGRTYPPGAPRKSSEVSCAQKVLARPDSIKPLHRHEEVYAGRVLQVQKEWPDKIDVILQAFRIGKLGIAAVPFKAFAETGFEIKAKIPSNHTFNIGQQDLWLFSYSRAK